MAEPERYVLRTTATCFRWYVTPTRTLTCDIEKALIANRSNLRAIRATLKGPGLVIKDYVAELSYVKD